MPISQQVRMMRTAISPRLAISTLGFATATWLAIIGDPRVGVNAGGKDRPGTCAGRRRPRRARPLRRGYRVHQRNGPGHGGGGLARVDARGRGAPVGRAREAGANLGGHAWGESALQFRAEAGYRTGSGWAHLSPRRGLDGRGRPGANRDLRRLQVAERSDDRRWEAWWDPGRVASDRRCDRVRRGRDRGEPR